MYAMFQELVYEAEVMNIGENPELLELSEELCNEVLATRNAQINELRQLIYDRGECKPIRTDDDFLLRFLRAKYFKVRRAHKLLVRYCTFREQYKYLYEGLDLWSLSKAKDIFEGNPCDIPGIGRLSVFRIGLWNPNELDAEELIRTAYAMFEIGIRQPKIQVIGGTIIIDMEGLSLSHVSAITPTTAYQIVSLLGLSLPTRMNSIHLINYSWLFNSFWYLFKRFIPQEALKTVHFHGSDLKSLRKHVNPECLHPRYGGTCRSTIVVGDWFRKLKKYRDEKFDRDMKELGYVVKE